MSGRPIIVLTGFLVSVNTVLRTTDGEDVAEDDFKEEVDFAAEIESKGFLKISCPLDETVTTTFKDLSWGGLCPPLLELDEYNMVELLTSVPDGSTVVRTSLPPFSLHFCKRFLLSIEERSTDDLANLLDDSSCSFRVNRLLFKLVFLKETVLPTPFDCNFSFVDFVAEGDTYLEAIFKMEDDLSRFGSDLTGYSPSLHNEELFP